MKSGPAQRKVTFLAYRAAPVTFFRRVVFGRDPYWRQYFWSRWGFIPSIPSRIPQGRPILWLEALSGGEVTQMVTLCRMLRQALPDWSLVLSTNTRYSFEFARANLDVDLVFDTPWDCFAAVRRALRRVAPTALVVVQNLTSPLLVREARRLGVTTVLLSGLWTRDVPRHPMFATTLEWKAFRELDWIGAWSQQDVHAFVAQGARPDRVLVTGNLKFDFDYLRVPDDERRRLRAILQLPDGAPVFLAASVFPGEEALAADAYLEARREIPDLRFVLVPRYPFHIPEMTRQLVERGLPYVMRSAITPSERVDGRTIVVDTFGELGRFTSLASVVFLGGTTYARNAAGLGQNPLEALINKRPFFFGPVMNLWRDITEELKAVWGGVEVTTARDLSSAIVQSLTNSVLAARLEQKTEEILTSHRDDVRRNLELVLRAVGAPASERVAVASGRRRG